LYSSVAGITLFMAFTSRFVFFRLLVTDAVRGVPDFFLTIASVVNRIEFPPFLVSEMRVVKGIVFMLFSSPSPFLIQDVKVIFWTVLGLSLPALFVYMLLSAI
jgi:hypothetical protein